MTTALEKGQHFLEEEKIEVAPGIFQEGKPIANTKEEIVGCSLHPGSEIRYHIVGNEAEVVWCLPRGSDSHILIGRTASGLRMGVDELKTYSWFGPFIKRP